MRKQFQFDKDYVNLNHGSFGTYPLALRSALQKYQAMSEARPDHFIRYQSPILLDRSRSALADYLRCPVDELVFVPNASTGVNTVLRSLTFAQGQKIVYFSTTYGACQKAVHYVSETTPAEGVEIELTYPLSDDVLVEKFRATIRRENGEEKGKVKVAILDTVVSLPGVRTPFERLVEVCREEGVLSMLDGAHGAGHLNLHLSKLDADFFVSNCHKYGSSSSSLDVPMLAWSN